MNRNLFEIANARYLNKRELVDTFIPTDPFYRILSPKNQIIIGSRGSGKTALLKMISHDHLALLDNKRAKEVINAKLYIGVHISTKTKFIGGLRNKDWQNEKEKEFHFRWLMNIASCLALLETIKSCLDVYVDKQIRTSKELEIIEKISLIWFPGDDYTYTIADLEEKLGDIRIKKSQQSINQKVYGISSEDKPIGLAFDMELFDPLMEAISIVNKKLEFPTTTTWFICIDEIEILEEFHHRILNSYMRAYLGNVFFKFTTLPYCHYTLETNTNAQLEIRHDVDYVYIDQDATFKYKATNINNSALQLFQTRARLSKPEFEQYDLNQLFGSSKLLDRFGIDKEEYLNSDFDTLLRTNELLLLFEKYASEPTLSRGLLLLKTKQVVRFGNEIGRKMKGLLLLKHEYETTKKGNQTVTLYSGAKIVVNVGDANPRKLLEIFNEMLTRYEARERERTFVKRVLDPIGAPVIGYDLQNFVLVSVAERELSKYRVEKNFGQGLFDFITIIGEFMKDYIHNNKLTTEQISSIDLPPNIDDVTWKIVERAVQKGLLYPNINVHNPDEMPYKEGTFHLGFILSPKFKLLPRRGDSRSIMSILPKQLVLNFDA